jgi:hypothetical protein
MRGLLYETSDLDLQQLGELVGWRLEDSVLTYRYRAGFRACLKAQKSVLCVVTVYFGIDPRPLRTRKRRIRKKWNKKYFHKVRGLLTGCEIENTQTIPLLVLRLKLPPLAFRAT